MGLGVDHYRSEVSELAQSAMERQLRGFARILNVFSILVKHELLAGLEKSLILI